MSTTPSGSVWPWDQRYLDHPWPNEPEDLLVELVTPLVAGTALDLGCGTGRNAIWLAGQGWRVTGVDASEVGLDQARRKAEDVEISLELERSDILEYQLRDTRFDLVILAYIHLFPAEQRAAFQLAADFLVPGGHLFVVGHHLDNLGYSGPPDPKRLYSVDRLRAEMPPILKMKRLERIDRSTEDSRDIVVLAWAELNSLS